MNSSYHLRQCSVVSESVVSLVASMAGWLVLLKRKVLSFSLYESDRTYYFK